MGSFRVDSRRAELFAFAVGVNLGGVRGRALRNCGFGGLGGGGGYGIRGRLSPVPRRDDGGGVCGGAGAVADDALRS